MKDRFEVRFTIATDKIDSKFLKAVGKSVESKLDRLTESITKAAEIIIDQIVKHNIVAEKEE